MRFFIRVLLLFFIISAALSILRGAFSANPQRPRRAPEEPRPRPASTSARLVKDPVCGTYVPESSALRAGDVFFCSEECRGKYLGKGNGI